METTLAILTLNEIVGLKEIMPKIDKSWVDEILFIDGGSTDGTLEYLQDHGYKYFVQSKPGGVAAQWEAIDRAKGDIVIMFSPDGNSDPEAIPRLIKKIRKGNSAVIASRYLDWARSDDDSSVTAFGNFFFTKIINLLFGSNYTDALVMYKAFRKDILDILNLRNNMKDNFDVLFAIRCKKYGASIVEIPANEPKRIDGGDSRAHAGFLGRIKGGLNMMKVIILEMW